MHMLVTVLIVSVLWLCPLMSKAGTGVSSVMVPKNWTDVIAMRVGSLNCHVPVAMPPQTRLG
jgi:hypothetical protein